MKIPQLTFTRFLAAMAIVVFHFGQNAWPFTLAGWSGITDGLNQLVSYFFSLSGFILVVSSVRNGKLPNEVEKPRFYLNRFARIYPLYFFAFVLHMALAYVGKGGGTFPYEPEDVFLTGTLLQSWFPEHAVRINSPGWSLSVEALFYASFPFLFLWFNRMRLSRVMTLTGVFWLLVQVYFAYVNGNREQFSERFAIYFPLHHLGTFMVGMAAGFLLVKDYNRIKRNARHWRLVSLISLGGLFFVFWTSAPFASTHYHAGLNAPVYMACILALSVSTGPITRLFAQRPLEYLGEISYGIYILHFPWMNIVKAVNKRVLHWNEDAVFWLCLVTIPIFAAVCFELVEKPARERLRKLGGTKPVKPKVG